MIYAPGTIDHKKILGANGIFKIWLVAVPNDFFFLGGDGILQFPDYDDINQVDDDANFYKLDLVDNTKKISVDPKDSAAGSFFEHGLTGQTNYIDQALLYKLETLRYCRVQVLYMDRQGRTVLLGSPEEGMKFSFKITQENKDAGTYVVDIELSGQSQDAPLFTSIQR